MRNFVKVIICFFIVIQYGSFSDFEKIKTKEGTFSKNENVQAFLSETISPEISTKSLYINNLKLWLCLRNEDVVCCF